MQRFLPLACALAVVAAGACGARSSMVGGDASGGGGTGAQGGGSVTQTSNTVVSGTTSTNQSVVTSVTASSSTGGPACDGTGDCQFCAECAQLGPCNDEVEACFTDPDCEAFAICFGECQGSPGCFPECAMMHPTGVQLYLAAIQCVLCDECPNDCGPFAPPELCSFN